MKLSNIILEIKRIGKGQKSFKVPVYVPGRGNEVLEFEKLDIDFKFTERRNSPISDEEFSNLKGKIVTYRGKDYKVLDSNSKEITLKDGEKTLVVSLKQFRDNGTISTSSVNRKLSPQAFATAGISSNFFKNKNSTEAQILQLKDKIESGTASEKEEQKLEKLEDNLLQQITKAEEGKQDVSLLHYLLRWNVTLQKHLIPAQEKKLKKASGKREEGYKKTIVALEKESKRLTQLLEPYKKDYPRKFSKVKSAELKEPTRIQPVRNFIANTKGMHKIFEENPEYIVMPLPKLLRTLEIKHKIALSDLLQSPKSNIAEATNNASDSFYKKMSDKEVPTSTASGRELFLKVSEFDVDTSGLDYKMGIYTWIIDSEIRYVGLTTDTSSRPGNYGRVGAWTSAMGATADRVNAYITKRLENVTSREEAAEAVKVFTAKLEPTPEVEKAYKEGKATGEITHGTFENWFKQSVLSSVEGQVKAWSGNLGSGKVDVDNMKKVAQQRKSEDPKVNKGRGTYGRSGDINVDPISKALDPDSGEDLFE